MLDLALGVSRLAGGGRRATRARVLGREEPVASGLELGEAMGRGLDLPGQGSTGGCESESEPPRAAMELTTWDSRLQKGRWLSAERSGFPPLSSWKD